MELQRGTEVERYAVEAMVGRGGMATVYQVRHTQLGTVHALKVLHAPHGAVGERLLREGRVQATLRHPNVVAVTDVLEVGGAPGLLMEYIPGPSLAEFLQICQPRLSQVDDLVCGVLAGVGAAHQAGLVHRDLKPANILLQQSRGRVVPKVADFGLAKVLDAEPDSTATRTGAVLGTPSYMAPEQIRSARDVDARADIFAIGTILYELLAGKRAFLSMDTMELFHRITTGDFIPLDTQRPDLPDRVVRATHAALEIDRDSRPADCVQLWSMWADDTIDLQVAAETSGGGWPSEHLAVIDQLTAARVPVEDGGSDAPVLPPTRSLGAESMSVPPPAPQTYPRLSEGDSRPRVHQFCVAQDRRDAERDATVLQAAGVWLECRYGPGSGSSLQPGDSVLVYWSSAAKGDPWMASAIDQIRRLDVPGTVRRLDNTELPPQLAHLPVQRTYDAGPLGTTGLAVVGAAALLVWLWTQHRPVGGAAVLLGAGALLWWSQWARTSTRYLLVGRLTLVARWLESATPRDILGLAERVLDAIYGRELLSVRTVLVSMAISLIALAPAVLFVAETASWDTMPQARDSLVVFGVASTWLALVCIVADLVSLLATRQLIRWANQRSTDRRLLAVLLADVALLLLCFAGPVVLNVQTPAFSVSGSHWIWPTAVAGHLWLLATRQIRIGALALGALPTQLVVNGLAAATAALPSLVHLPLLVLSGVVRRIAPLAPSGAGRALLTWLGRPGGPWPWVLVVALVAYGADQLAAGLGGSPPEVQVDSGSYTIGCLQHDPFCSAGEGGGHVVELSGDLLVLQTEVTQGWWRAVWDTDPATSAAWGLPRTPSTYRGVSRPVETISWCDAVRFANLASLGSARDPVYCQGAGCETEPSVATASLPGCDAGATVGARWQANGYRLPTEAEWEVLTRRRTTTPWSSGATEASLANAAWYAANSGLRTHDVKTRAANPWGLYDVHGNVSEWVWDRVGPYDPDARVDPRGSESGDRIHRGGGMWYSARACRSSVRLTTANNAPRPDIGMRLVRLADDAI